MEGCGLFEIYNNGLNPVQGVLISYFQSYTWTVTAHSYTESETITETESSYSTIKKSDLSLLAAVNPHYSNSITHPLTGEDIDVEEMIENDDSGEESLSESQPSTVDPTILVIPASAKAHSGVSR